MRFLPFLLAFGAVLSFAATGLGHRTLWADELETAERARAVLAYGRPEIYDPRGNLSLNAGGREIEEGRLHRYTPWAQFYAAAAGLAVGPRLGLSPDASARLPFAVLHSLASGIVAEGLVAGLSLHPAAAVAAGVLYGANSVRLIHARTARYHALTDFLFVAAWAIFGVFRRRKRAAPPSRSGERLATAAALALVVGALLHTHTLVGLLAFFVFGLCFLYEERVSIPSAAFGILAAGAFAALLALVRPWEQSEIWGRLSLSGKFRSLRSFGEVGYAFQFLPFTFLLASGLRSPKDDRREWRRELGLAALLLFAIAIGIRGLDFHPYSQVRYYLPILGLLLFWPLAIGTREFATPVARRSYFGVLVAALVLVETTPVTGFYQGLRLVALDVRAAVAQPVREALAEISARLRPGDGVLYDYVPQAVNWYLPTARPALIPDAKALSQLGRKNPDLPKTVEPEWHVSYPASFSGFWVCESGCDYARIGDPAKDDRYLVHSRALGKDFEFCVVRRWMSHRWANSPFVNYRRESLDPTGFPSEPFVLAKRCD